MILRNPTDNNITVQIEGRVYSVSPKGTIELPNRHGSFWKEKIHGFMQITASEETAPEAPAEEEIEEETPDVLPPELVEDKKTGEVGRQVAGSRRAKH